MPESGRPVGVSASSNPLMSIESDLCLMSFAIVRSPNCRQDLKGRFFYPLRTVQSSPRLLTESVNSIELETQL